MQPVTATFDHLALWHAPLDAGARVFSERLSAPFETGGAHAGQGTRNRLMGAGEGAYLELLGPDEDQAGGPLVDRFASADPLSICLVAYRTRSLDELAKRVNALGVSAPPPFEMSREKDGQRISWRLLYLMDPRFPQLPFFIDWGETAHPSSQLADVLSVEDLACLAPEPSVVEEIFKTLDIDLEVRAHPQPGWAVKLKTQTATLGLQSVFDKAGAIETKMS